MQIEIESSRIPNIVCETRQQLMICFTSLMRESSSCKALLDDTAQILRLVQVCRPENFTAFPGTRRELISIVGALCLLPISVSTSSAVETQGPLVRLDLAPDQRKYDPNDENLRNAANMLQSALNAESVQASPNAFSLR